MPGGDRRRILDIYTSYVKERKGARIMMTSFKSRIDEFFFRSLILNNKSIVEYDLDEKIFGLIHVDLLLLRCTLYHQQSDSLDLPLDYTFSFRPIMKIERFFSTIDMFSRDYWRERERKKGIEIQYFYSKDEKEKLSKMNSKQQQQNENH